MHSTFQGLWVRQVIRGGGGGGRKCTSAISRAERSGGVVWSSSAPSVCGIPPPVGDEGVACVVHAGASATGEKAIFLFFLFLGCTPVGGVPAAATAAASVGAGNIAGASVDPVTTDRGGTAAAAACVTISCWVEQAGTCSCCSCRCVCCGCSCCCCSSLPCCC